MAKTKSITSFKASDFMILPENNRIPEKVKSIHLIAICGTAMGAFGLRAQRHGVSGNWFRQQYIPTNEPLP
jgi:hypothetical protein